MPFVLDASVTITWLMRDEEHPLADLAFNRIKQEAASVPAIWWYEIRNMLVVNERRGRISEPDSVLSIAELSRMRIILDSVQNHSDLVELARRYQLTVYDAAYLELAIRKNLPLATLDKALIAAAKAAGVALLS